jgi:hypothetical protein
VVEMAYSCFEKQTAVALAKKFQFYLSELSSLGLVSDRGSFDYDYSFLDERELNNVLYLASYDLNFMYQFTFKKEEPNKLFYTRSGSDIPEDWSLAAWFLTTFIAVFVAFSLVCIFRIHNGLC